MSNIMRQSASLLNRLDRELPEGLLAHSAWLRKKGYSRQLLGHYVAAGWLERAAHGVFRRPRGTLSWQQAVVSLQTLLPDDPQAVGGRTALELQGYAHFLPRKIREIHLYGPRPLPTWLGKLPLEERFVHHNSRRLFGSGPSPDGLTFLPLGLWDWRIALSTPERALLELLDELPRHESFQQVDTLMEGLPTLSPRRLQQLLVDCESIKVKRLFFFFADRHAHAWLKRLNKDRIDLGAGNRMLVAGGKLDRTYRITVPDDLDAV